MTYARLHLSNWGLITDPTSIAYKRSSCCITLKIVLCDSKRAAHAAAGPGEGVPRQHRHVFRGHHQVVQRRGHHARAQAGNNSDSESFVPVGT
jgi:hypothetical protein